MKKPNFFIVGAPKCGTTAMSEYLRAHPNIFMSDPKEPNYFSRQYVPTHCNSEIVYLQLFEHAQPCHKIVGEASVRYIHSERALAELREFQPKAKLAVMLRKPSELVRSYHSQMVKEGFEKEPDFERAWHLQHARKKEISSSAGLLKYKWIGSLGTQVENLLGYFENHQIHFILYDDFSRDPGREYEQLLTFLGVPDDNRRDFSVHNSASNFRWHWLGQFPRRMRRCFSAPLAVAKNATGIKGTGIIKLIDRVNLQANPGSELSPEFSQMLDLEFRDEVARLERCIGRDLTAWRENVSGTP